MYPTYTLQVYSFIQGKWINTSDESASTPSQYRALKQTYQRYRDSADDGSPTQAPIGYRIIGSGDIGTVVIWTNGKIPVVSTAS